MARRPLDPEVADRIRRDTDGERTGMRAERLEALDTEAGIGDRPTQEVIAEICRLLGLDPVRMTLKSPLPKAIHVGETSNATPSANGQWVWQAAPPPHQPDG